MNNDPKKRASRARRTPTVSQGRSSRNRTRAVTAVSKSGAAAVTKASPKKKQNSLVQSVKNSRPVRAVSKHYRHGNAAWEREEVVRVRGGVDGMMLAIILVLVAFGCVAVFSASYPEAVRVSKEHDGMMYIKAQLGFCLAGFAVMAVAANVKISFWRPWAHYGAYGLALVLLIAAQFVGTIKGVTKRWINIFGINVQPSEIMKVGIILMLAWYFDKYEKKMSDLSMSPKERFRWHIVYPYAILGTACVLVLLGKHLSGTIIVACIGALLCLVGGSRILWLIATGLPIVVLGGGVYLALNPYAWERVTTYQNKETADVLDEMYQTMQGLYAIGSGGLFGVGLGESRQKFSYLYAAHTDFIFAIWCEEWGFLGAVALIVLFLLFLWRGYLIALRAPDKFTMLTAFGITTHIGLQAFFNMCVVTSIFPNTGVTMPFFSYGGSSLIINMFEMGVLLAISKQYYKKKSELRRK